MTASSRRILPAAGLAAVLLAPPSAAGLSPVRPPDAAPTAVAGTPATQAGDLIFPEPRPPRSRLLVPPPPERRPAPPPQPEPPVSAPAPPVAEPAPPPATERPQAPAAAAPLPAAPERKPAADLPTRPDVKPQAPAEPAPTAPSPPQTKPGEAEAVAPDAPPVKPGEPPAPAAAPEPGGPAAEAGPPEPPPLPDLPRTPEPPERAQSPAQPPEEAPSDAPAASVGDRVTVPFQPGVAEPDAAVQPQLDALAARLAADPDLRLRLNAYAPGTPAEESRSRRLSLSRALAVRSRLVDAGISSTRIEVRALGSNLPDGGSADRVDIIVLER